MDKIKNAIIALIIIIALSLIGMTVCLVLLIQENKAYKKENAKENYLQKSITGGIIEGYYANTSDVIIYKGIPFAAPPIGDLRWRPPQDVIPWKGVLECKVQKSNPMQTKVAIKPGDFNSESFPDPRCGYSEDCLHMNIWTNKKGVKMPVVFFVYGGSWISGSNSVEVYNGEYLASQKVIFVCPNYRVGLFGFIGSDVLQQEDPENSTGNYGLMDLIKGLQWVRDNIEKFGGDKNNIILYGGSAGANLIDMLMISPKAKGLFHRAFSMSFPLGPLGGAGNLSEKKNGGNLLMPNKEELEKLRKIPADEFMKKYESLTVFLSLGPSIDNIYIKDLWRDEVANQKTNDIDYIIGYSHNDNFPGTGDGVFAPMIGQFPDGITDGDVLKAVYSIAAKYRIKAGATNTYVLQFSHLTPNQIGAVHEGDKPFMLNYFSPNLDKYLNESDYLMGKMASSYLINFCRSGDPNAKGLPLWKKSIEDRTFFELGDNPQMKTFESQKYEKIFDIVKEKQQLNFIDN